MHDGHESLPDATDGSTLRAAVAGDDLIGQVIADRYHVERLLGEGGMGRVYLAEHVRMRRRSAVKVMGRALLHDRDALSRFNREGLAAVHPHHGGGPRIRYGTRVGGNNGWEHDYPQADRHLPRIVSEISSVAPRLDGSNVFEPAEIEAKRGDVIRYILVTGVHNVSFSAAGERAGTNLPQPSGLLDSAGQTLDVPVRLAPGEYAFRCDPHLPFDMVGKLTVE